MELLNKWRVACVVGPAARAVRVKNKVRFSLVVGSRLTWGA